MAGLDVEALLESAAQEAAEKEAKAKAAEAPATTVHDSNKQGHGSNRDLGDRDRGRGRDRHPQSRSRSRSREYGRRGRDGDGDHKMNSPPSGGSSAHSHHRSRRHSRSRSRSLRRSGERRGSGDYYRGGGRVRSSRSPDNDRFYRPGGRDRRERDDFRGRDHYRERDRNYAPRGRGNDRGRDRSRDGGRRRSASPRKEKGKGTTPEPNDDERDRRTVFVQQLAARLRTKDLVEFFSQVGPVKEVQIVKDRVSGRSKGLGYVEFKNVESVPRAIELTGQQLLGIPIIAQVTEAEKNRLARVTNTSQTSSAPFHRLYVGNIHFSITETDLQNIFEPFGELEFVQLQKDENGRSRGYGFVQFVDPSLAREALEKMNGFELAGRPIRVGLGSDKFTPESTANLLQRFQGQGSNSGSSFSGHGGRGIHAGGSSNFDKASGNDKATSAQASALDDTDVAGVNFSNYSRESLMRKLARTDDPQPKMDSRNMPKPKTEVKQLPIAVPQASRCIVLHNMFDANEEDGESWIKELEDDVKEECEKKYGPVTHISLDASTQGDIYVKFAKIEGGEKAIQGLNGRYFGGRQITAQPVVDAVYSSLFGRAAAL